MAAGKSQSKAEKSTKILFCSLGKNVPDCYIEGRKGIEANSRHAKGRKEVDVNAALLISFMERSAYFDYGIDRRKKGLRHRILLM